MISAWNTAVISRVIDSTLNERLSNGLNVPASLLLFISVEVYGGFCHLEQLRVLIFHMDFVDGFFCSFFKCCKVVRAVKMV